VTREEAARLCAYVEAATSRQLGELAPDAWHDLLGHLTLAECQQAVSSALCRAPFVGVHEIRREVAAQRCARLPHSNACRDGDHGDCTAARWCMCTCHPAAVEKLTGPPAARVLEAGADDEFTRGLSARTGGVRLRSLPPAGDGDAP
jgi:hypothetical protein